jgi:para-nitrobenzyl esterase
VWIPGGAFVGGSAGDDLYDGARLARRAHAVVVSMNYRLGALGFMAHPALARELGRAASPAFGILDQRAALEWVRRNIARVGGDPDNVTIFGQSAGAWSTCVHLVAPKSRGLFARAIMMSGACSDALYFTPQTAEAQGEALAAKVGCGGDDVLACLRKKSGEEILGALPFRRGLLLLPGVWWGPIVDGVELPRMPLTMLRAGDFAHVPLMIGSARDEGIVHTRAFESVTADELNWFVGNVFGDAAVKRVTERYQRATPKQALTDIVTDGIFACQARRVARIVSAQHVPVYLYQWTHALDDPRVHALGATHGIDLFFLFGNVSLGFGLQQDELPLAAQVMDAWGAFARSGTPETATLRWPRYAVESDAHMTLDLPIHPGAQLLRETCDFWDQTPGEL